MRSEVTSFRQPRRLRRGTGSHRRAERRTDTGCCATGRYKAWPGSRCCWRCCVISPLIPEKICRAPAQSSTAVSCASSSAVSNHQERRLRAPLFQLAPSNVSTHFFAFCAHLPIGLPPPPKAEMTASPRSQWPVPRGDRASHRYGSRGCQRSSDERGCARARSVTSGETHPTTCFFGVFLLNTSSRSIWRCLTNRSTSS